MAYEDQQRVRKCFATDFGELGRVAILGPRLANDGVPAIRGRVR